MRQIILFFTLFVFTLNLFSQTIFKTPKSNRIANYNIDVRLDVEQKMLYGEEKITWKNTTKNAVGELQFHLYLNAFKSNNSTFNRESSGRRHKKELTSAENGWTNIKSLKINSEELVGEMKFIQPEDANKYDSTVAVISLKNAVKQGEVLEIKIEFEAKLPKAYARTGYNDEFFLVGQWFPKLGVLEDSGWNCHQFHANTEFFADFGVYNVNIKVPKDYIVGASGIRVDSVVNDAVAIYKYYAEDIHDFAWTASPYFLKETRQVQDVEIELLYQSEHSGMVDRYFTSAELTLKYYGEWFIPYPYPKMTMVDPPLQAMGTVGGMEYPMFITCGSAWGMPENIRMGPEIVTIHEFGHNFFQGVIANNESEEAWLDEGMNSYAENKLTAEVWGEWSSFIDFGNIKQGDYAVARAGLLNMQRRGKIYQKPWEYATRYDYGFNSYSKSSLLLKTLENYLSWDVMKKIWKEYFRRFAFKHPKTKDFINTVEQVSGENMSWFFDQYLYSDAVLDYKVRWVKSSIITPEDSTDNKTFLNKICLHRTSDGTFPVKAQVVFSTNDTIAIDWDGIASSKVFEIYHEGKVTEVDVDPELKNYLDINWTNNSWRSKNDMVWLKYIEKNYIYLLQNLFLILTN